MIISQFVKSFKAFASSVVSEQSKLLNNLKLFHSASEQDSVFDVYDDSHFNL